MVRGSASLGAQIGRLATPKAEALGGPFEKKVQDFFREVRMSGMIGLRDPPELAIRERGDKKHPFRQPLSTGAPYRFRDSYHGPLRTTSSMRLSHWESFGAMCHSSSDIMQM